MTTFISWEGGGDCTITFFNSEPKYGGGGAKTWLGRSVLWLGIEAFENHFSKFQFIFHPKTMWRTFKFTET